MIDSINHKQKSNKKEACFDNVRILVIGISFTVILKAEGLLSLNAECLAFV